MLAAQRAAKLRAAELRVRVVWRLAVWRPSGWLLLIYTDFYLIYKHSIRPSASEVTPATEMGQLRQNFVLQSEAENEIYAGFLVSFSNQKPGMKFTPALFGFPFS